MCLFSSYTITIKMMGRYGDRGKSERERQKE